MVRALNMLGGGKPVSVREVEVGLLCYPERDLKPGMPAARLQNKLVAAEAIHNSDESLE